MQVLVKNTSIFSKAKYHKNIEFKTNITSFGQFYLELPPAISLELELQQAISLVLELQQAISLVLELQLINKFGKIYQNALAVPNKPFLVELKARTS